MDTRKKTQLGKTLVPQPVRRPSIEQPLIPGEGNPNMLEEIKRIVQDLSVKMTNLSADMTSFKAEIRAEIRADLKDISQSMGKTMGELSKMRKDIDKMKETCGTYDRRIEEISGNQKSQMIETLKWECKAREKSVRIRGLKEVEGENLMESLVPTLAEFLQCDAQIFSLGLDRIFRLNSIVAKKKKNPKRRCYCFSEKIF